MTHPHSNGRRFRVLQIGKYYPHHRGGMESHLQALCNGLRPHVGVRVLVANKSRMGMGDRVEGIAVGRLGRVMDLAGAPLCPAMSSRIRESGAELVHLHLPNPTAVLAYLMSGHRGRLVVSYHSDVVRQKVLGAAFNPILHNLLARSDAIVVATRDYLDSSPVLPRYRDRCHIIPYGVDVDQFTREEQAVARIRAEHGDRIILSVGRLVYYKGYESLIDAMPMVQGRLLIVGDGPLRSALEERARRLGVGDRVVFLGDVDDPTPYYHAADVFVLASIARSEAFGIVQLEAMACGVPVVNTALASGVASVSRNGESGITVEPGRPIELATAIMRLLENPELRASLGRRGRSRVEAEFSDRLMIERTLQLYHQVMETDPEAGLALVSGGGGRS
jgi:glycosyltransferase involved in cell wall biosynthesis